MLSRVFLIVSLLLLGACTAPRHDSMAISLSSQANWDEIESYSEQIMEDKSINDADKCARIWSTIWPMAKAGNKEARFGLFAMRGFSDMELTPASHNMATGQFELLVLYIHSLGASELSKDAYRKAGQTPDIFSLYPFLNKGPRFKECMTKLQAAECTQIAVDEHLIPSFEDFSAEVDAGINSGRVSPCRSVGQ